VKVASTRKAVVAGIEGCGAGETRTAPVKDPHVDTDGAGTSATTDLGPVRWKWAESPIVAVIALSA
jgi:hypothetical protein